MPLASKHFYNVFYDTLSIIEVKKENCENSYLNAIARASFLQELVVRKFYPSLMDLIMPMLNVQTLKVYTRGFIDDQLINLSQVIYSLSPPF